MGEAFFGLGPFLFVTLIALGVNVVSTLIYKYTTNQKRIKEIKKKSKDFQKEIRDLQKKNPDKAMKKQKEAMALNGELMKLSMKPMLYTMLPLLLLFAWLSGSLVYEPILPGQEFTITAEFETGATGEVTLTSLPDALEIAEPTREIGEQIIWQVKGPEGRYQLTLNSGETEWNKPVSITTEQKYEPPLQTYEGILKSIEVGNKQVRPFGENFSLFGWKPGMIGAYVILSIIFSIIVRRLMKVA
jgi:uncharacterized membrane protein (DUF106 family)